VTTVLTQHSTTVLATRKPRGASSAAATDPQTGRPNTCIGALLGGAPSWPPPPRLENPTHQRAHLRALVWLCVQPTQWLQVPQQLMVWQRCGQVDLLVVAPLGGHHNGADLLHLRVVRRTHAIHVPSNLTPAHTHTHASHQSQNSSSAVWHPASTARRAATQATAAHLLLACQSIMMARPAGSAAPLPVPASPGCAGLRCR
jgi:hypothetical protein